MTLQLPLFDAPHSTDDQEIVNNDRPRAEKITQISWSYSRRSLMEKCLRSYYYEYFGANKRTAKEEVNKQEIWRLKKLKNRYERTGELLHLVISAYLRKSKEGIRWEVDRLISWMKDLFSKDIAYSQSLPSDWELTREKYPPAVLTEFYYNEPDAMEKCAISEDRMISGIKSFMTNPLYCEFRKKGAQGNSIIEGAINLHSVTPCKIDGRIDLAYKDGLQVTVIDWKLGNDDGIGDDSLQLAAYGLWAVEKMQCPAELIRICKVHLGSETVVDFDCNKQVLALARARIMQDAERMEFLESYGKTASFEAFTPCKQEAICRLCAYVGICDDGKEIINA